MENSKKYQQSKVFFFFHSRKKSGLAKKQCVLLINALCLIRYSPVLRFPRYVKYIK